MTDPERRPTWLYLLGLGGALAVALGVLVLAVSRTGQARTEADARTAAVKAGPRVVVVEAQRSGGSRRLVLQGEARPYASATLYAKVSGYLKEIRVDRGDAVHAGQILAVIESPELDQQYEAAVADARNKRANSDRAAALVATGIESVQDADQARTNAEVAEAVQASLATQKSYEVIRAPVAGTVTARFADPGALLQNATTAQTGALPVVTVAELTRLRVDAYVDQRDAPFLHVGDPVHVHPPERPEADLSGSVARLSRELDARTRMMLAEIDLDNSKGAIVPGSFVEVTVDLKVPTVVEVPVEALVFRGRRAFVPVVSGDNRVAYRPVKVADDDGERARVLEGLEAGQRVALNLGDSVVDGDQVQPAVVKSPPAPPRPR